MEDNELFDWSTYGALVRLGRNKLRYKNTSALSDGIYRRTRMRISKDVLYRIEQNRQEPTAMQFLAINLTLFSQIWPSSERSIVACLSDEWSEYNDREDMPDKWRMENLIKDSAGCSFRSDDGLLCVFESDLPDDWDVYFSTDDYLDNSKQFEVTKTDEYDVIKGTVWAISGDYHICI